LSQLLHFYIKNNGEPYIGGKFGFFSSHASNNFAVATFLSLLLRNRYKWIVAIAFFSASLIAFSRLYLGVHYLSDLLSGALWGMLWAYAFFRLFHHFILKLK
jgi:undecaprenyl-diphosphatase